MTTTARTTALGGDEAAEQRSALNLDAGVVGDLALLAEAVEFCAVEDEANSLIRRLAAALVSVARQAENASYNLNQMYGQASAVRSFDDIATTARAALKQRDTGAQT